MNWFSRAVRWFLAKTRIFIIRCEPMVHDPLSQLFPYWILLYAASLIAR